MSEVSPQLKNQDTGRVGKWKGDFGESSMRSSQKDGQRQSECLGQQRVSTGDQRSLTLNWTSNP